MKKPIALITGASTGLGKNLALKLARQYFVYLISRNEKKLKEISKIILEQKNECKIIAADIARKDSIKKIYSEIKDKDNIELLINNAGKATFKNISNQSIDEWDEQINTNLRGSFLMTKMIVDGFKSRKCGTIVFMNSIAGISSYKDSTGYVASKHGLRGFASALRKELREYNIKVISVFPGATNTPIWDNMGFDNMRAKMMQPTDVSEIIIN